jgi:hypothetical protein
MYTALRWLVFLPTWHYIPHSVHVPLTRIYEYTEYRVMWYVKCMYRFNELHWLYPHLLTIHRNIATCMTHSVSRRKVRKCVWLSQTNLLKNDARFPRLSFSSQQCVLVFLFAAYLNGAVVNTKCLRYFFLHRDCQWTFILRLGGQCVLMPLYNVRYIGANCNMYFLLLFLEV